ncbi:hypothetical protein [Flagellimonas nanhaiensis]|uniref:Uncharacterized protein n=1 Tax=Flagellimonas nanhaiensis TaxID=2292706 RepID=A0A371JQN4_9FLAO|nr:hypothetical protein [Allomuricauda nanhaiensis]RDY59796.1 hypothetical protein DX873_10575 [Allomuricauda nanhaiensis]
MKSSFKSDLQQEKRLTKLLDSYYKKYLVQYSFKRISSYKEQLQGIDLVLIHKGSQVEYFVDEKAQLDYINESLPTFALELFYEKNSVHKQGWLFDQRKKTQFYSLVTSIYSDEENVFTSCNITFVNRSKLIEHLNLLGLTSENLQNTIKENQEVHGKLILEQLHPRKEGYLFFSTQNKAEKPVNLILKLDYLIEIGVGKKFI